MINNTNPPNQIRYVNLSITQIALTSNLITQVRKFVWTWQLGLYANRRAENKPTWNMGADNDDRKLSKTIERCKSEHYPIFLDK